MKATLSLVLVVTGAVGVSAWIAFPVGHADEASSPIFGVKMPAGYRQLELVAVAHELGLDELRGVLGDAEAMRAYRKGALPFPDCPILDKLAWKHASLAGVDEAFVIGPATTVQFMVKDRKKICIYRRLEIRPLY